MSRAILILFFGAAFFAQTATAQQNYFRCGTVGEDAAIIQQRLRENKAAMQNNPVISRDFKYVPVKFHLIAKTDGTGMVAKNRVLDELCILNEEYAEVGIQFYIKGGFNYIYNNTVYSNHQATQNTVMTFQRDNAALNIFIPENADPPNQAGPGVVLGYYSPAKDWLVIAKSEVGIPGLAFPHEMGHFFSLNHPFYGWDYDPWDQSLHGNPVMMTTAPDGITPVELANGSNCETAGDEVCDTPADYLFGFGWDDCNFTTDVRDRNNQQLNPDERLWLNYFFGCNVDDYYFTDMQEALMIQDYYSNRRNYIRSGFTPSLTEITEAPTLEFPANTEQLDYFNSVQLDWSDVPAAEAYLLQVSLVPTFSSGLTVYDEVVYGTSKVITILSANRTYYWRVRPFSAYRTCTNFSSTHSFKTGSLVGVQDNNLTASVNISPNPVSRGQELNVSIRSAKTFDSELALFSMAGQRVRQYGPLSIQAGANQFSLSVSGLNAGVYLLAIDSPEGKMYQRIVVTR
ncbi:MAG: zinc-dependent metalloprotease [Phaeodactylibacter sp.]|nr:zinc-dependent metalloprotease [Phaeodactylibacter sp.]MCB9273316.1 T9SS type A sorting domain-containing protein [Lewinellaceae bacterium]